jgi:hypothetical protein
MTNSTLSPDEIHERLRTLNVEHRDLDQVIARLADSPPGDELLIRRLKKRKLLLKDRIDQLQQMLITDEPA